jgi:hypothetical protein
MIIALINPLKVIISTKTVMLMRKIQIKDHLNPIYQGNEK